MMMDYRELLLPLCARKEEFEDMPEPRNLTSKQIRALEDIFDAGQIIEISERTSAFDRIFKDDPDYDYKSEDDSHYTAFPLEWIVARGDEFYYVDNEGHSYSRYGFRIPDEVVNNFI